MPYRDERIYEEAVALWRQLYGEPPPRGADGARILCLIMAALPDMDYARFSSRHLRASVVTFPKRPGGRATPAVAGAGPRP